MLESKVIKNKRIIIQMPVPSMVSLRRMASPMLMPMKKMGMRLQKISMCPTA